MAQEPGSRLHALGSNPWFIDRSMKILGLIEERFDESDNQGFRVFFPGHGLAVDFASYFCGNPALEYEGNGKTCRLRGDLCVSKISLSDDSGLILMGGCAMDRRPPALPGIAQWRSQHGPCSGAAAGCGATHGSREARHRHDLPFPVVVLRRSEPAGWPHGHLRPQHRL